MAVALYPKDLTQQKQWPEQSCHCLKHENGAATLLYQQMLELSHSQEHPKVVQDKLMAAVTYFHNHQSQMNYAF